MSAPTIDTPRLRRRARRPADIDPWTRMRADELDVRARYFDLESGTTSARAVPAALPRRPSRRTIDEKGRQGA